MPEYSSGHEALCKEFTRECVELAMLTTPAVRVEGELVGALRRELAPHLSADIEGALWFSGLVGAYGVNGLVLQTDVRRVLGESLTRDPRAEAAWQIIYECHKSISPALLSEEIIAWHGMNVAYLEQTLAAPAGNRQPEDTRQSVEEHRQKLDDELHKVLATLKDKGRTKGLGQWARRAVPSFPKAALTLTPTWAFNLALSSRGEKTVPIPGQPPFDLFERGYSGLFDGVRMRQVAVRRSGAELALGPLSEIPGFCIQVPDTEPCMVRIEWSDSSGSGVETLQIAGNQTRRISVGYGPVRIHTLDGAVYDPDSNAHLDSTPPEDFFGAWPTKEGTYFRMWAPNADRVIVATFPGESYEELRPLGDGTWQGFTADAKIGQEYKLLLATGKHEAWHVDPYARKLNNTPNGIICDRRPRAQDEFRLPPYDQLVLYEIHIGSFNRRPSDAIGTFHTAAQRLSYLVDLGVNAVLLMPVHTRPTGNSWGFDPSHIFAVTEDFGGPEALRQFILKAHAHGIGVLLQLCLSHAGPENLLWNFDARQNGEQDNGCYFFPSTAPRSKGAWGPNYNISREEVRRYLRDNVMMWFEEYGIDGIHWDTVNFSVTLSYYPESSPHDEESFKLIREINQEVRSRWPDALITGGAPDGIDWPTENMALTAMWSYSFVNIVRNVLIQPEDPQRDIQAIQGELIHVSNNPFERVLYLESHDDARTRLPEQIDKRHADSYYARKRSLLGATLLLTAPGIPMLFHGQEMLESRAFDSAKWHFDWNQTNSGYVQAFRDLIHLRTDSDGPTGGLSSNQYDTLHENHDAKVLAYSRSDQIVVVLNFGNVYYKSYWLPFPIHGHWQLVFNGDNKKYDPQFKNRYSDVVETSAYKTWEIAGEISLAPYSGVIYVFDQDSWAKDDSIYK